MPQNKFTDAETRELLDARERGETYKSIADRTGRTINSLRNRVHLVTSGWHDTRNLAPQRDTRTDERVDPPPPMTDETRRIRELEHQLRGAEQRVADLHRSLGRHVKIIKNKQNTFRFALISDTHYGSLYHDTGALHSFLRYVAASGVTTVLHAGDVLEGEKMHFGQDRELSHAGLTQQLEALAEFPHGLGLDVKFITGNHDICYVKASGVNVGQMIADATGWECLGDMYGEVSFDTPSGAYRVGLFHPRDGSAYAMSYKLQKIIEQWTGGKKPHMLVVGHYHKALSIPQYRNVHAVHPGCFQQQTPFMAGKGLAAHVGGWIVEVTAGGEKELWNAVRTEFVSYY